MLTDQLGFAALLAVSGASVAWFFPARRYMILLMRSVAAELEDALKPIDRVYELLGLYVGFRARFIVRGLREFRALLVLIPRHALLYLPFVVLRGERDTLILEAEPPGGTLFNCIEAKGKLSRTARRQLRRAGAIRADGRCPQRLRELLNADDVTAVYAAGGAVGVVVEPRPGRIGVIASRLASYARSL